MSWQDYIDTVQKLYIAYYQRPADPSGLRYWAEKLDIAGGNLEGIIDAFATSPEAISLYDTNGDGEINASDDLEALIEAIYQALFNRIPDEEGKNFYLNALQIGQFPDGRLATPGRVALDILNGAQGDDALTIENKLIVANLFTHVIDGRSLRDPNFGTSSFAVTYAGEEDAEAARDLLKEITSDPTTVLDTDQVKEIIINQIADPNDLIFLEQDNIIQMAENYSKTFPTFDYSSFLPIDDPYVQALISGYSWDKTTITYGAPTTLPQEYNNIPCENIITDYLGNGWQPLADVAKSSMQTIFQTVDSQIALNLIPASDPNTADIRISMHDAMVSDEGGFAFYPGSIPICGDIFINSQYNQPEDWSETGCGAYTLIHELGHALGLKHPFEAEGNNTAILPSEFDNYAYTVMSYTPFRIYTPVFTVTSTSIEVTFEYVLPTSFMVLDLAALHALYGPNPNTNTGNDIYRPPNTPFYQTIYDAGGVDTIDLSATFASNQIDLTPGSYSNINYQTIDQLIAEEQDYVCQLTGTTYYNDWVASIYQEYADQIYTGEHALSIAFGTIIENVIGGPKDDWIIDNQADNHLIGGAGNDYFFLGHGGYDTVDGGEGYDIVWIEDYASSQIQCFENDEGVIIIGPDFSAHLIDIEKVHFAVDNIDWLLA